MLPISSAGQILGSLFLQIFEESLPELPGRIELLAA
jgi:hypothetical protein